MQIFLALVAAVDVWPSRLGVPLRLERSVAKESMRELQRLSRRSCLIRGVDRLFHDGLIYLFLLELGIVGQHMGVEFNDRVRIDSLARRRALPALEILRVSEDVKSILVHWVYVNILALEYSRILHLRIDGDIRGGWLWHQVREIRIAERLVGVPGTRP